MTAAPLPSREDAVARWMARPASEVIDHILVRYHGPLKQQLAELGALAKALVLAAGLTAKVILLVEELGQHLIKEERVAFQMIRASGGYESVAFGVMEHEHVLVDRLLTELRTLTDGWRVPPGAPAPLSKALALLALIDADLPEHAALEEALFVRVRSK